MVRPCNNSKDINRKYRIMTQISNYQNILASYLLFKWLFITCSLKHAKPIYVQIFISVLNICFYGNIWLHISIYLSISIYLPIYLSISIYLPIGLCLSVSLSVCLSVCLYLSIYASDVVCCFNVIKIVTV